MPSTSSSPDEECGCVHPRRVHTEAGHCAGCHVDSQPGWSCLHRFQAAEPPGPHVHEWSEFQQGSTLYPRALQVEYAHCDCGASKARRAEDEKCGHVRLGVTEDSCFRPKGHPGMHESKLRVWTDLADEKPQEPECTHHFWGKGPVAMPDGRDGTQFTCTDCGHVRLEPLPAVCTHCQGPHALEDCKGLEEPEEICELPHQTTGEEDECERQRLAAKEPPAPRRPPYAVAYAVEGGALYEVAVPGDATVVAEDGCLQVLHPKRPVLAIVRITPVNMEDESNE